MNRIFFFCLFFFLTIQMRAQFIVLGDTLYGNEWIKFDQEYYKIPVTEDGIYRINKDDLLAAGLPVANIMGKNFQMFHNGEEYPMYISTNGSISNEDFIEFYGRKNRGEIDQFLYTDPETMQLNPEYSLFTDTSAYFLTWNNNTANFRVISKSTDLTDNFLPAEKYYMHKELVVLNNRNNKPTRNGADNVRYSHFDIGEGFGGNLNKKNEVNISSSRVFADGPDPSLNIRFTTNGTIHTIDLSINNDLKKRYSYSGYKVTDETTVFPISELKNTNKVTLEGMNDEFDRNAIATIELSYPRMYNLDNKNYANVFVENSFFEKYIEIENFNQGSIPLIYDPGSRLRISPVTENGKLKFVLPGGIEDRTIIIYNGETAVKQVIGIEKMAFENYEQMKHDYIIISHPKLRSGSIDYVQAYSDYRSSQQGGSFDPIIINIEKLYDQFSYGIKRHSYAVKNFANYISKKWDDPKYIFIIGKAREYANFRTKNQLEDPLNQNFSVPTYGYPGSDNLLVSTGNNSTKHSISMGRLAAKNSDDIKIYFEKVIDHENFDSKPLTVEDRLWKKRVMHLVGAKTDLQESIGSYLENMENIIENNQFGADVTTFRKSSTETIQEADADAILNSVDQGLSILTFFGHSSVGTFDFNIDDVSKLQNFGKYPLVISLGCYSGNIHTSSYGISEQYVETASKGAIGFIASSSTAYVQPQGSFGASFYNNIGGKFYGQSIGDVLSSTLETLDIYEGIHIKILAEQITLHGDPAVKLHKAEGPDYLFDYNSFTTEPTIIESNQDSFQLRFKIANIGKYEKDSINLKLEHYTSSGALNAELNFYINAPKYDTLVSVVIPNQNFRNVGKNIIKGEVDALQDVNELPNPDAENNNILVDKDGEEGFIFYSINNSAEPVSPCNFGIHNKKEVQLQASTYNAMSNVKSTYILEIDSTANFDSNLKQRKSIESHGGLLDWEPNLNYEHGKVYYWRVSPDSLSPEIGFRWVNSSFVYLPNSSNGWNQSHYFQFLENDFDGISMAEDRNFEFDTSGFFIKIFNSIWDPNTTGYQYNFENYAVSVRPWNFMKEGIAIVVADEKTGSAWVNSGGDYGSINSTNFGSYRSFGFKTSTPEERLKVIEFLENGIPDGSFVFFWTVLQSVNSDFKPELWENDQAVLNKDIYTVLESHGSIRAREMADKGSVPYTFIFQKGREVLSEEIGNSKQDYITSTAFISVLGNQGHIISETIGPAKQWQKLIFKGDADNALDTVELKVIGIDLKGKESIIKTSTFESEVDLSDINAEIYPRLKLDLYSKDGILTTPVQLKYWRVLYEGFPDVNLNTSESYVFQSDTLEQGEPLSLKIRIDNLSAYETDSMNVEVNIIGANNQIIKTLDKLPPILDFNSSIYEFTYNTKDLLGKYQISLNVNSEKTVVEKNYFNNFGVREFLVIKDIRNPVLDVSFDGTRIFDGDIVSPTPFILISLKDENKFLLLDDPGIAEIILVHPDNTEELIEITDERLRFEPAKNTNNNEAKLEFTPDLEMDGTYVLKVNGTDISKNQSGDLAFERSFEVINEQLISNVLNYPNPFSTSTEFIFTLTGREIPDEIKIEVLTVTGKVVKEIFKEELGPLKIGINRTSYKWDGTDDYGNKLANGVYLYRVIAKNINGKIDNYQIQDINQYFKNNLGKLVILR